MSGIGLQISKTSFAIIAACMLINTANTANAASVYRCTDKSGALYFSDIACPRDTEREVIDVHNSPSGNRGGYDHYSVTEQARRMDAQKRMRKQEKQESYDRYKAESGPSWADRNAAKNAMRSVQTDKNMYRHKKSGARDAAEMAIQYNAESVSRGGTHQVRVPDVKKEYHYHDGYNRNRGYDR